MSYFDRQHEARFWTVEGDDPKFAHAVMYSYRRAHDATAQRQSDILARYGLYGDPNIPDHLIEERHTTHGRRLRKNYLAAATDSIVAQISQDKPKAMFTVVGGSWDDQQRAKKLTQYSDMRMIELEIHDRFEQVNRDGIIAGTGFVRAMVDEQREQVRIERVFPLRVVVDDAPYADAVPPVWHLRHYIDRYQLATRFPEHAADIERAPRPDGVRGYLADPNADVIEVIEAWHLPSPPLDDDLETDGVHALVIDGVTLLREEYRHDGPPLVCVRPVKPLQGWWGISLFDRAVPIQTEMNSVTIRMQEAIHRQAVPRWFMRAGDFKTSRLHNNVGIIIETKSGKPPVPDVAVALGAELPAYALQLKADLFGVMGASEDFAQAQKPAELRSGRAQTVYYDHTTRRQIFAARAYAAGVVALQRAIVRCERDLDALLQDSGEGRRHEVLYRQYGATQRIEWSQLDLDDDRMRIQAFPVSALPTEPAARIQMLTDMLQGGIIDQQLFWQLSDIPDVEGIRDLVVAPSELIRQRLDMMLDDGKARPPEPYMDLRLCVRLASMTAQRAEIAGAPEGRIELIRTFAVSAQRLLNDVQPPAPMLPPGGGPVPPPAGPPMPPPGAAAPPQAPPMPPEGLN